MRYAALMQFSSDEDCFFEDMIRFVLIADVSLNIETTPPPCISYALVQATVGVGTLIIVYVILIRYGM